jgi:hypothetical protein
MVNGPLLIQIIGPIWPMSKSQVMTTLDKRLARLARLNLNIAKARMLIRQQTLIIKSGKDTSDQWGLLVNLEESLENLEREFARLMRDNPASELGQNRVRYHPRTDGG